MKPVGRGGQELNGAVVWWSPDGNGFARVAIHLQMMTSLMNGYDGMVNDRKR